MLSACHSGEAFYAPQVSRPMTGQRTGDHEPAICQLCNLPRPLIEAHIFPRQLYKPIRESSKDGRAGDAVPHIYKPGTQAKPLPRQSGIYDRNILCADCDRYIGRYDKYGQKLLSDLENLGSEVRTSQGDLIARQIRDFDYPSLKLFYMSILWRASITSQSFFNQVRLGPWKLGLRQRLVENDPGDENCFSVIPFSYTGLYKEVMMNPSRERHGNINFYRFRHPNGGFLVKVDKQKLSPEILPAILSPNSPLLIRCIEYTSSSEYRILQSMLPNLPQQPKKAYNIKIQKTGAEAWV